MEATLIREVRFGLVIAPSCRPGSYAGKSLKKFTSSDKERQPKEALTAESQVLAVRYRHRALAGRLPADVLGPQAGSLRLSSVVWSNQTAGTSKKLLAMYPLVSTARSWCLALHGLSGGSEEIRVL